MTLPRDPDRVPPADESGWTLCTTDCTHRGPYRVTYPKRGLTFTVGPKGATADYCLLFPLELPVEVRAPHDSVRVDGYGRVCRALELVADACLVPSVRSEEKR